DVIIPMHIPTPVMTLCFVLAAVGVVLGLVAEAVKLKQSKEEYNVTGLAIFLVYIVVHAFGFLSIPFYQRGFMTVTAFHAVQYLSIVWLFENRQEASATLTKKVITLVPGVYSFFLFWILLYFIGDAIQSHVFTMGDA